MSKNKTYNNHPAVSSWGKNKCAVCLAIFLVVSMTFSVMLYDADADADATYWEEDGIAYHVTDDQFYMTVDVVSKEPKYSGDVVIPESVTHGGVTYNVSSIGKGAFTYCVSLTSVSLPNSITSIGQGAFHGCKSLTSVNIPSNVWSIGHLAFCYCESLTSVTIPSSVTSMGGAVFEGCSSLNDVYVDAITPPSLPPTFPQFFFCPSTLKIHVPEASLSAYQSSWGNEIKEGSLIPNIA